MVKKLKALAGGAAAEGEFAQTVRDSAQQIWLAGLGAFAKAQERGTKFQAESARIFDALVREGEARQSFVRKVTGKKVAEAAAKASGTWDKLEQVFEDRVARALSKLGVHTQSDVERLSERVDALSDAVNELIRATGVTPPKARKRASSVSTMMKGAVSTATRTASGAVDVATKTAKRTARTASGAVGAATKTAKRTVRTARKVVKGALG